MDILGIKACSFRLNEKTRIHFTLQTWTSDNVYKYQKSIAIFTGSKVHFQTVCFLDEMNKSIVVTRPRHLLATTDACWCCSFMLVDDFCKNVVVTMPCIVDEMMSYEMRGPTWVVKDIELLLSFIPFNLIFCCPYFSKIVHIRIYLLDNHVELTWLLA